MTKIIIIVITLLVSGCWSEQQLDKMDDITTVPIIFMEF